MTTTIMNEQLRIDCPYVRAKTYLHRMLSPRSNDNVPHELELNANVPATHIELAKHVLVRFSPAADRMHFDEPWQVNWIPEPGGIYPSFQGQLTVRADEGYRTAVLELQGTYTPPLGAAGKTFDSVIGRRIAAGTAQNLLGQIARDMREQYLREEAAKKDAQYQPKESM